jgi:hypothetical protein
MSKKPLFPLWVLTNGPTFEESGFPEAVYRTKNLTSGRKSFAVFTRDGAAERFVKEWGLPPELVEVRAESPESVFEWLELAVELGVTHVSFDPLFPERFREFTIREFAALIRGKA